jgi:5'-nucleotidase
LSRAASVIKNKRMKLLLTNDDGIDAPGLLALQTVAVQLGEPVVVAPVETLSGCSHRVTTDCVRVGLHSLAADAAWVLSGINQGGNLGADVWHSGTVAAAREAVLHGWQAVALSHYHKKGRPIDWQRAAAWVLPLLRCLLDEPGKPGSFWNVNLPHLAPDEPDPEPVFCRLDPSPLPLSFHGDSTALSYNGDYHARQRKSGTDVDVCFGGQIAVSRIHLF